MKKLICVLCCVAILISSLCISAFADTSEQFIAKSSITGDANGDSSVNLLDLIALRKKLALFKVSLNYENIDIDGDCKVNVLDLLLLRKMLAKYNVTVSESFAKDNIDINSTVEDMGIPSASVWSDWGGVEKVISRNPYDMVTYGDYVFISNGNFNTNQGPVYIYYVGRDSERCSKSLDIQTEQANKFYIFDNKMYTLAIDPIVWMTGSFYAYQKGGKWTQRNVLKDNIHCFDMIKHNGKYFFAGSNVNYTEEGYEESMGTVYACDENDIMGAADKFSLVPIVDRYNQVINYENTVFGVPRVYELMEFEGELYALFYNWGEEAAMNGEYGDYSYNRVKDHQQNGVYKYNDEKNQFEYCDGLTMVDQFKGPGYTQDRENVMTDFEWNNQYIVVNDALYVTDDLKTWETRAIPGYEDYIIRDCQVIGDKLYFLANVKVADGKWTNAVFESSDLRNFRRILYFDTANWLRSFAYTNGTFIFCVGAYGNEIEAEDGSLTAWGKECGRVYRYKYYN